MKIHAKVEHTIRQTKCHDLVLEKKWEELVARLATEEGRKEARIISPVHRQLIFHMDEIFEAPVWVLRAAYEAYPQGWLTPFDKIYANATVYPIVNFIAFKSDKSSLQFMLDTFPDIARQSCWRGELDIRTMVNYLPLQHACAAGYDNGIKILLEAYPQAVSVRDEYGALPIFLGCRELSFESMQLLLAAYPDAVYARDHYGDTLLHKIFDKESMFDSRPVNEQTARMIFDAFPTAAAIAGRYENLPIHIALYNREATSLKLVDSMINKFPRIASKKGSWGHLPLHICCEHFIACEEADSALFLNLNILRKLLRLNPDAIFIQNECGRLPIECLVDEIDNIKDFALPRMQRIFEILFCAYPGSLLREREDEANAFVTFVAKRPDMPLSTWSLVASLAPKAILDLSDSKVMSPLAHSLYDKFYLFDIDELEPRAKTILKLTTRALRSLFFREQEKSLVSSRMPLSHMFAFCCHLLKDINDMPLILERDQMPDEKGNLPIHAFCFAPCPKYSHGCNTLKDREVEYIQSYLNSLRPKVCRKIVLKRNAVGELPLHVLLSNKNARQWTFDDDIKALVRYGPQMITAWDPFRRLYPFMQAAMNIQNRSRGASCSTTFSMLRSFITTRNLTQFSKSGNLDTHRPKKRAKYSM